MSSGGSTISLISKGIQDTYLNTDELSSSLFRKKFTRHTNFSQAPKLIKTVTDTDTTIVIPHWGDLVNAIWFEGPQCATKFFVGSTIDLYIGGVKVDSHPYEYLSDIWTNYLADTWTKSTLINNKASQSIQGFVPLHFFFCDGGSLPLCALAFHEVEIKITLGNVSSLTDAQKSIKCYANYIYLDTPERTDIMTRPLDLVVSQLQHLVQSPIEYVSSNATETGGDNKIDLSQFNHPVRSIFWGVRALQPDSVNDRFTFRDATLQLNGVPLFEQMSPLYFNVVQNFYNAPTINIEYSEADSVPFYTRYFGYHFCTHPTTYTPSGSVNFSRLDSARLDLTGVELGDERYDPAAIAAAGITVGANDNDLKVFALSWNVLHLEGGLAGLKFSA
jgi:hypothetical protein